MALLLLPWVLKLDGRSHAEWLQFLGRFHPLAVHLPIGLIVLLPVLEIAGRSRPALRESAPFVLTFACFACLGSLILGYMLAYGSGETGLTVTRHLWGAIALSIGMMLSLLVRPSWSAGTHPRIYPILLFLDVLALVWTAHLGGAITHGDNYLTAHLPPSVKPWVFPSDNQSAGAEAGSFYAQHIHPVLDANCIACHGPSKVQGGLRVDSYDMLMKGGKDGPVVLPRNSSGSLLLERLSLPANNEHFMPAEGRPPLKSEQIAWIRAWIDQGASNSATSVAGVILPAESVDAAPQPVSDYSALMPEIQQMQQTQGAKLMPLSAHPSDGLILSTADTASTFNDAQLATFQRFAPFIVEADLARTAITDASLESLSKFTHLRVLHLENTAITGQGLTRLKSLSQLTYLNLSGTKVDSAAVAPLQSMSNLHRIYLFETPAHPERSSDIPPGKP